MAPPRAEIGDSQPGSAAHPLDLLPQLRHGAGVEDLQLESRHAVEDRPSPEFHDDGERRDLPHHDLRPRTLEGQLVLPVANLEVVVRQPQRLEPLHELRREHLPLAVEGVAAQPGALAAGQRQRADVIKLLAQLSLVNELCEADAVVAVDQAEGDRRVRRAAQDRLAHQQLVEVGIDERADDRVDLPLVDPNPGGDVDHGSLRPVAPRRGRRVCGRRGPASWRSRRRRGRFGRGRRPGGREGFSHPPRWRDPQVRHFFQTLRVCSVASC